MRSILYYVSVVIYSRASYNYILQVKTVNKTLTFAPKKTRGFDVDEAATSIRMVMSHIQNM